MGHVWAYWGALDRAIYWYGSAAEEGDDTDSLFHLGWAYEQRGYPYLIPRMQAQERAVEVASSRAQTKIQAHADEQPRQHVCQRPIRFGAATRG
jgi:hypothetical protein